MTYIDYTIAKLLVIETLGIYFSKNLLLNKKCQRHKQLPIKSNLPVVYMNCTDTKIEK